MTPTKTIGQLNGYWAMLLKFALAVFPIFLTFAIAWGTWITSETFANKSFRSIGDRVVPMDLARLEQRLQEEIRRLPPADWRMRILKTESDLREIRANQIKILTVLERLEKK